MKRQLERLTILMSSIALIVPLVGVAPVVSATTNAPEQIDTDSSVGDASVAASEPGIADGSLATVPGDLPSQAAMDAAAANDLIEEAALAAAPIPIGDPIVPQSDPVILDIEDGSESDPLANTAPQAFPKASKTASPIYRAPVSGTFASFSMSEVSPAGLDVAALPESVQIEIDTAAQWQLVEFDTSLFADALEASNVSLDLFHGITLDMDTSVAPSPGALDTTLYVAGVGEDSDAAVITISGDEVIGQFWSDGKQFGLQPVGAGQHAVFEIARDFDNSTEPDAVPGPSNGPSGLTVQESGGEADIIGLPAVEVMVAYDDEAFAFYGNDIDTVRANAAAMVNLTNAIYRNTDQQQHMNLTHIYATNTTPNTNDIFTYRNQLASKSDGNFDGVHVSRDIGGSDIIVLLSDRFVNAQGFCGVAFFPVGASPAEDNAYNVTEASCALFGLTFPHELGHNQCAGHDLDTPNACGYTDGTGHVDAAAGKRTVMARNSNTCCERQPVYSNPGHEYLGWETGVTGVSDNAGVLEIEDLAGVSGGVANYRVGNGVVTSVAGIDGKSCIYGSLEAAFANAPAGSTIYVAPGIHVGQDPVFNFNITWDLDVVQGTPQCEPTGSPQPATNVVIQPAPGSANDGVIEIRNGANVRFERITIENGISAEGNIELENGPGTTLILDGAIVRNGNNPANGGGVRVLADNSLTMVNNGQITSNTAVLGGGVYVDGGTFTIADVDDVEDNNATHGGGIYATNGSQVRVENDGDVNNNTATGDGGGVYLTGDSDLEVTGSSSHIGFGGQGNSANRGGGVFIAQGSVGSKVTIGELGAVEANTASFGAGVYLLNGEVEINDDGAIIDNVGGNGGGILAVNDPDTFTVVDLNRGALVSGNTGGFGAGLFMSTNSELRVDGGTTGGVFNPVVISGNASTSNGGGLYMDSAKPAVLDTVHFHSNSAVNGGAINLSTGMDVTVDDLSNCGPDNLAFEQYCSEFRDNSADFGGAVYVNGATFIADRTAFFANTATTGAQAVQVVGASTVELTAMLAVGHDSLGTGDGSFTAADTSQLTIKAATSADGAGAWLDFDGSATGDLKRIIADTAVLTPEQSTGTCNLNALPGGSGLPNAVTAEAGFVTTSHSDYVPNAASPAVDNCKRKGVPRDILGRTVKNGDGIDSSKEYDFGAFEASTGLGHSCAGKPATIVGDDGANVIEGTAGPDVIVALGGADDVDAKGGKDTICLGSGSDTADGGSSGDTIKGGSGADTIVGGSGHDTIDGNGGSDDIRGDDGNDEVNGNKGADIVRGGDGDDLISGGPGSPDICRGGSGTDQATGGCEVKTGIP